MHGDDSTMKVDMSSQPNISNGELWLRKTKVEVELDVAKLRAVANLARIQASFAETQSYLLQQQVALINNTLNFNCKNNGFNVALDTPPSSNNSLTLDTQITDNLEKLIQSDGTTSTGATNIVNTVEQLIETDITNNPIESNLVENMNFHKQFSSQIQRSQISSPIVSKRKADDEEDTDNCKRRKTTCLSDMARRMLCFRASNDYDDRGTYIKNEGVTESFTNEESTFILNNEDCVYCSNEHSINDCTFYKSLTYTERLAFANMKKLCFKCLQHMDENGLHLCTREQCTVCNYNHNSLLHPVAEDSWRRHPKENSDLQMVIPITVLGLKKKIDTYAVMCPKSQVSLLDANIAKRIGVEGSIANLKLKNMKGELLEDNNSQSVRIIVRGPNTVKHKLKNIKTVTNFTLPSQTITKKLYQHFFNVNHFKFKEMKQATPKMLLGADFADLYKAQEVIEGPPQLPAARRTNLGWTLEGQLPNWYRPKVGIELQSIAWSTVV